MGRLESMVNEHLKQKQVNSDRMMRNKLHPSTIGMCQRKIAFEMIMVPYKIEGERVQRIFENGHSLHHRYESMFEEMGILVQSEMKIEKENISGHTDAWIKIRSFTNPEGEDILVELKSASSRSFDWMKENNTPKKEHKAQLMFYMHLTGIKKGIIFVENKDNQDVWEHELDYDEEFANKLFEKANYIIEKSIKRVLPEIPDKYHTPSSYQCKYCSFNFYCHSESITKDGEKRFVIPFEKNTKAFKDCEEIINAMKNNKEIPNVIEGSTKGELIKEIIIKSKEVY
jgi:CRISPR/Cas system-associated exonuclease Cas4 (RecB family)